MSFWLFYFMEKFASIYEGRFILSSNGYVIPQQGRKKGKRLYGTQDTGGYIVFGLWHDEYRAQKKIKCHRLIASAFIPNPENKPFVNHINGIKNDNRIENLEWCTHRENIIHSARVLKVKNGIILNSELVLQIRELYKNGLTVKDILYIFPIVKYITIYNIVSNRSWKNVKFKNI